MDNYIHNSKEKSTKIATGYQKCEKVKLCFEFVKENQVSKKKLKLALVTKL